MPEEPNPQAPNSEPNSLPNDINTTQPTPPPLQQVPAEPAVPVNNITSSSEPSTVSPEPIAGGIPLDTEKPSGSKKKIIIIVIIILTLITLISGTAFAVWYNSPDKVVGDAITDAITSKTVISDGSYELTDSKNKGSVKLTFNTKSDTPNFAGEVEAKLNVTYDKYDFDLGGGGMIANSGNVYFKFDGVKATLDKYINDPEISVYFEQAPELKTDLVAFANKIDGQWVKLDKDDLKEMWKDFDHAKSKDCYTKAFANINKQEISDTYNNNRFIVIKDSGGANINGVDSAEYTITADVNKYNEAMKELEKTNFVKEVNKCDSTDSTKKYDDYKMTKEEIKDSQKQIDKAKIKVWISRASHSFTKTTFEYTDDKEKVSNKLDINYKFNETVTVADPAKSISMKEVQADLEKIQQDYQKAYSYPSSSTPTTY